MRFRKVPPGAAACAALLAAAAPLSPSLFAEEAPLRVVTVAAEAVPSVEREFQLTGTVTARRQAKLSSRTGGLLASVAVDAGSLVKKGDLLATLDTRLAEISLEFIAAEIAQAEVELAEAKRRAEEVREISRSGGFPKSEAESRKTAVLVGEAALAKLRVREAEQVELIERHRLVAPFGGVISQKFAEAGEWVATGTPVVELVETEAPRFDLRVPQEFLARISATETIEVVLDSYPDRPFAATVEVMVPVKDEVSRTFLTRLDLDDPEGMAAPGMSGRATIRYRTKGAGSVTLPRDAVVRFPDGTVKVWIVENSDGRSTVRSQVIRTTESLGAFVEVIEGLAGGETVVVKGNEGLLDGQTVSVEAARKP